MEKIYMEENKGKKRKKQSFDFSVALSFVVAIFAVFSLATFGIVSNQGTSVSYAAGDDSFTLSMPGNQIAVCDADDCSQDKSFAFTEYFMNSTSGEQIYCVERAIEAVQGNTYQKEATTVDDMGLIYILNHAPDTGDDLENTYVLSASIWLYLFDTKYQGNVSNAFQAEKEKSVIMNDNVMIFRTSDATNKIDISGVYSTYIKPLVAGAKSAEKATLTVTKADDKLIKTSDGSYYQTESPVVVSSNYAIDSYNVSLSGIDGAKIVDENGQDMATTDISPDKKFYVRIPSSKIDGSLQKLKVTVVANIPDASAHYYTSAGSQKLIRLYDLEMTSGTEIEITGAPDTGMNVAQTIYFIGLIVLICGIGIVYANAKPVEVKQ